MWTSSMLMGNRRKPPFSLSGTFATNIEGWIPSNATYVVWASSDFRTAPGSMLLIFSGGATYAEYTVSKEVCAGLTITPSIWHKSSGAITTRNLSYRIGTGSFVTLATATDNSLIYTQMSGSFDNPGDDDVTIRVSVTSNNIYIDDWAISGV